ncbi:response regulator transcription factor [Streptomyces sp. TRM70308]|uniref:response regulator transcription factor n=1 Tax=Streptomyces sp. TRM70308 TaxID=3131932 RepID=UPI003D05E6DD
MRLLLVEDDEHVAAALTAVLARHGFRVVHARTGEEALERLLPDDSGAPFAVVLLDIGLPDQSGFEVCGRIRRQSGTPVIMVTARADVRSRIHGLNLGADDYVVKPYDTGELLARIHAVSRRALPGDAAGAPRPVAGPGGAGGPGRTGRDDAAGAHPAGAGAAGARAAGAPVASAAPAPGAAGGEASAAPGLRLGPVLIEPASRQVRVHGEPVALTRKEFDLLALLAQRPGVVYRREQIISEVWRTSWEGTGRTLEVHVASLRAKLGQPALIETVRGVGYRLAAAAA